MNKKEAAIITSYTGISLGCMSEFHKYAEKLMGRPIFTHEFANLNLAKELKEGSKEDFLKLHAQIMECEKELE